MGVIRYIRNYFYMLYGMFQTTISIVNARLYLLLAPKGILQKRAEHFHQICRMPPDHPIQPLELYDSFASPRTWINKMCRYITDRKSLKRGDRATDLSLMKLDAGDNAIECHLLDFMKPGRPLVVHFGSSTCPPFMGALKEFNTIVSESNLMADFVIIYTREAHPTNGYSLASNPYQYKQPESIQERLELARILYNQGVECPILVDNMSNCAAETYGAVPVRICVIQNGWIIYQGGMGPVGYNMKELKE